MTIVLIFTGGGTVIHARATDAENAGAGTEAQTAVFSVALDDVAGLYSVES